MSRFISSLALVGAALAIAACDLGTVTVPTTAAAVVIHSVLNPNASNQVVLVEQTLTGTITIPDSVDFNANDPITTSGGIPISGAVVELTGPSGKVVRAVEDFAPTPITGRGTGVYRFAIPGNTLVLGGRYQLHVHTPAGDDLTAFTRIPHRSLSSIGGLSRTFNRDHDVLATQWSGVDAFRTYAVRIETPFGPFFFFTDSSSFRASGDLRNIFSNDLDRVFIPGFRQDMVVAAVDSNFYDYYRTNNDPFTGSGIISRVTGGLGLFGSIAELNTGTISVVADQSEPIESRFRAIPSGQTGGIPGLANQITLYIESKAARSDLPSALTGRYTTSNAQSDGIIGQLLGTHVTLALLVNQLAGDTIEVFTGELHGDTLVGTYKVNGGPVAFLRSP